MCVSVSAGVGEVMMGALRTLSSNGSRVCKIEAFGYWFKPFLPPPLGTGARVEEGEKELKNVKLKLAAWILSYPAWTRLFMSFSLLFASGSKVENTGRLKAVTDAKEMCWEAKLSKACEW